MKKHHTKEKGDIGVFKIKLDLALKGFMVLSPETEHSPFDIVAYDGENNKFFRIQAKFRHETNGFLDIRFKSSYADKNRMSRHTN